MRNFLPPFLSRDKQNEAFVELMRQHLFETRLIAHTLRVLEGHAGKLEKLEGKFRDAAVTALLKVGNVVMARTVFFGMTEYVTRKPEDLRVRLLEAYLQRAEREKLASH